MPLILTIGLLLKRISLRKHHLNPLYREPMEYGLLYKKLVVHVCTRGFRRVNESTLQGNGLLIACAMLPF